MRKLLVVFTICLIIDLTIGGGGGGGKGRPRPRPDFNFKHFDRKADKICSNMDAAQEYLKQTIELIGKLEANTTYAPILQKQSPNFLRFFKDSANQDLLKTNCEEFFEGLQTAQKADRDEGRAQGKLVREIQKQFKDIKKTISKQKNFAEFDI